MQRYPHRPAAPNEPVPLWRAEARSWEPGYLSGPGLRPGRERMNPRSGDRTSLRRGPRHYPGPHARYPWWQIPSLPVLQRRSYRHPAPR